MSMINWEDVPPQGRLWIFTASSPWQADQMDMVDRQLSLLCHGWTAHGESVAASYTTVDHRLIALTADESALANASGCSIDNMMGQLQELSQALHTDLFDRMHVYIRPNQTAPWRRVGIKEAKTSEGQFLNAVGDQMAAYQPITAIKGSWLRP